MDNSIRDGSLERVTKKTYRDYIDPTKVKVWSIDVLKLMAQSPHLEFTIDDLVGLFNISRQKAARRFRVLVRFRLVKRRGEGHNLRFQVSNWGLRYLIAREKPHYGLWEGVEEWKSKT